MGKRVAQSQLSKDDLGSSGEDDQNGHVSDDKNVDSAQEIAQRKIVKVKRSIQSNQEVSTGPGKLQLSGGLNSATKTEYNKDDKSEDAKSEVADKKRPAESSKAPAGGLFGNLSNSANQGTSLFGGAASTGTSLFGSGFKFTPASASTTAGAGIFGGGSLFGSSATPASGSIFGNSNAAGGSLFSQTGSLFGGQNALFKAPASKKEEESGDEDEENFGKGDGSPPAFGGDQADAFGDLANRPVKLTIESRPPQKSPYEKIFNNTVEKFKKVVPTVVNGQKVDEKKSMGKGSISIEVAEINGNKVYISVFRNLIGKTLYQGTISSKFSKKRRIEEKAMKQQLKLALVTKDAITKKQKVEYLITSFTRSDDLKQFESVFDEAMETLKKQEQDNAKKVD